MILVEGRHDDEFLRRLSAILHAARSKLPDLWALQRSGVIVFIPAGGDDFRPWLSRLAPFGCAEFHLFDRELTPVSQQRMQWAVEVNRRLRCRAFVTRRRSLENYLHPRAIEEARGIRLTFTSTDDVAELSVRATFVPAAETFRWEDLSRRARRRARDRAKRWLNTDAVERMTVARLAEADPEGEVVGWLTTIAELLAA